MATVNKNFRIKNGLIVEGGTATVGGFDVLTKAQGDQDYIVSLIGGTATSANESNKVVKRDANGNFAAGTITATFVGNVTGTVSSLSNHDTDDLAEGSNLYFTNARALSATAAAYDAVGSAAAAQAAAEATAASDATSKVAAEAALRVSGDAASVSTAASDATSKANAAQSAAITAAATDATTKANAAQAAAEATAAGALSTAISTEVSNRNTAISTAVSGLVDGAPALLDTLNELALALGDSPDTITNLTTSIGEKLPKAGGTMSGAIAMGTSKITGLGTPTDNTDAATKGYVDLEIQYLDTAAQGYAAGAQQAAINAAETTATNLADAAQAAAEGYADGLINDASNASDEVWSAYKTSTEIGLAQQAAIDAANDLTTDDVAEGTSQYFTDARARTAVDGTTRSFTAVELNSVAKQVAATTGNIAVAAATTAISWVAADYRSAKFVVKVKNGVHTQVSDLVVTLDTANNVAVSEYGITYSNGTELAAVTADYSGTDVRVRVTPANANTEVVVVGTLIK